MKKKNKGGRPRVALTEKKKYKLPPVRLDTKNYVIVKNLARRTGLSLTEYQRQMVLHGRVVERLSPEMVNLFRQLAGMGNNMNQLARQANTFGYRKDVALYHENALLVNNLIEKILYDGKDY